MDVNGRVAFITGAAAGIGFAIATAFAQAGAHVALADVDEQALRRAAARIQSRFRAREVTAVVLDVRDRHAFAQAADAVEERLGPIEILCNNAGVGSTVPVTELTYDVWDHVLGINLGGVVNGVQTMLPRMLTRAGPGHIVNVASGAGLVPSEITSYVASKFAVVGLTESLALQQELAVALPEETERDRELAELLRQRTADRVQREPAR